MFNNFFASQSVELLVPQAPVPIDRYLKNPQQIVKALCDPSLIEQLSKDTYRLKMRSLKFFMLKIEPVVEIKIWTAADGTVLLQSTNCELRGIETINEHFQLNLSGTMQPCKVGEKSYLKGGAELGLKIYLPPPFTMMPRSLVQSTGNSLLGGILLKMKKGLMRDLLLNYRQWAMEKTVDLVAA
ncbi:MAG: DUF1997 domain-containing protein [Okeania sp. SIO2H7]|nr:DUF1997 domain-containing protein [Okeania sp. SIO2H7]